MVTASHFNADIDFGIPARGNSGESYRGHIFWDELYIFPLYFMHFPDVAKACLMYKYRRLDKAKELAINDGGYEGAMYPWQSGSTGVEETQVVHLNPMSGEWGDDFSRYQRHVNLAHLYNIYMYWHYTRDVEFMNTAGFEMFLEICKFWGSAGELNPATGKYSIDRVMGPDEYHEKDPEGPPEKGGLVDNAYTNVMVCWSFNKAFELM